MQNNSRQPFHNIKLIAEDGGIIGISQGPGSIGKLSMQGLEDLVFATHIVGRFGLVSEGRSAQNHFAVTDHKKVSQVRMPAGKLANLYIALQSGNGVS